MTRHNRCFACVAPVFFSRSSRTNTRLSEANLTFRKDAGNTKDIPLAINQLVTISQVRRCPSACCAEENHVNIIPKEESITYPTRLLCAAPCAKLRIRRRQTVPIDCISFPSPANNQQHELMLRYLRIDYVGYSDEEKVALHRFLFRIK